MTFGEALTKVKEGSCITRAGWNGKKQFVVLATNISFYVYANNEFVNPYHDAIGNTALAFYGTSGWQIGWLASQADMLAEDWEAFVPEE